MFSRFLKKWYPNFELGIYLKGPLPLDILGLQASVGPPSSEKSKTSGCSKTK